MKIHAVSCYSTAANKGQQQAPHPQQTIIKSKESPQSIASVKIVPSKNTDGIN